METNLPLIDRTLFDVFIAFLLIIIFSYLITFVNNHMSKLATYHEIQTGNNPNGEWIFSKFGLVLMSYLNLILPIFISLWISLKLIFLSLTVPQGEAETIDEAILIYSLVGTLVIFVLMRFLMNLTEKDVGSVLKVRVGEINENVKDKVRKFKERILSLFFSYVFITLLIFIFFLLANLYGSQNGETFYQRMHPFLINVDPTVIPTYVLSFFIALVILAAGTEILLITGRPIIQDRRIKNNKSRPLTLETFETFKLSRRDLFRYYLNHKVVPSIRNMPSKAISFIQLKFGYNK